MSTSFTGERILSNPEDWREQIRFALKTEKDFDDFFSLSHAEREGFRKGASLFNTQATPYYASLVDLKNPEDPIRKMILPNVLELAGLDKTQADPLGENRNRPTQRIIHRYADRALFLITDFCGIYCRYCTRKHFTGQGEVLPSKTKYQEALDYIKTHTEIREVILSGGDPLTLSNAKLDKVFSDLEAIPHINLIRVGSRMPAACPMRLDEGLKKLFKRKVPLVLMSHFNHHQELSEYTKKKLRDFADSGVQIFNQMVLLNGVNNSAALVYKLSRELLSCKVFPYYMFQCDPSPGTNHLQTSVDESLKIQRELWGRASGLALPTYSVDIPSGGGKAYLTPDFIDSKTKDFYKFRGFDGVEAHYLNDQKKQEPFIDLKVQSEWDGINKN